MQKLTVPFNYNDIGSLERIFSEYPGQVAAVIMEPIGVVEPGKDFLNAVKELVRSEGALLIFDEVITGFRLAMGGAQEYFNIIPDITTLGKIMGGGFPVAAYGGKKEIMSMISPIGKVYQASTLSGNPVSVTAGITTLKILIENKNTIYNQLEQNCIKIKKGLKDLTESKKILAQINNIASMFQIFFTEQPVIDFETANKSDKIKFMGYHKELMKQSIFVAPSQFETCFISTAHSPDDIQLTLEAMDSALD